MKTSERALPGYWVDETSGALRPAVAAYLNRRKMTAVEIAAVRAYFRQWIENGDWKGAEIETLRRDVDLIDCRAAIDRWLAAALRVGIDPL
jgi:hypothetical protein